MDPRDCQRMTAYLANQMRPALKQAPILEIQQELQRELTESLLGNWLTSAELLLAQQRSQQLLRALQAQAGVHGKLLEWLRCRRAIRYANCLCSKRIANPHQLPSLRRWTLRSICLARQRSSQ